MDVALDLTFLSDFLTFTFSIHLHYDLHHELSILEKVEVALDLLGGAGLRRSHCCSHASIDLCAGDVTSLGAFAPCVT